MDEFKSIVAIIYEVLPVAWFVAGFFWGMAFQIFLIVRRDRKRIKASQAKYGLTPCFYNDDAL